MIITVICHDTAYTSDANPLIYTVDVADPSNAKEVETAVNTERTRDLGEPSEVTAILAFAGDLTPVADWRD